MLGIRGAFPCKGSRTLFGEQCELCTRIARHAQCDIVRMRTALEHIRLVAACLINTTRARPMVRSLKPVEFVCICDCVINVAFISLSVVLLVYSSLLRDSYFMTHTL